MIDTYLTNEYIEQINCLPSGGDFAFIRANNKIYADKTAYVLAVASIVGGCFFLSRPRRFGKSTFLSTLKELFLHGVSPWEGHDSYFKGLYIEDKWTEEPGIYTVVHLDFSAYLSAGRIAHEQLEQNLLLEIKALACRLHINLNPDYADNFSWALRDLLQQTDEKSIVLLIDEYDAPLTRAESTEEAALTRRVMQNFYAMIKMYSSRFRLLFITGITRYKDTALFSMGNFIRDISQSPPFAAVCGYTRAELIQYFASPLRHAAAVSCRKRESEVSAEDLHNLLEQLALWYDGFYFGEDAREAVFSTWSVLSFFNSFEAKFRGYWIEEGGDFPALIRTNLHRDGLLSALDALTCGRDIMVTHHDFTTPASLESMNVYVLLFQTGYLTFKEGIGITNDPNALIPLQSPNLEATQALPGLMARIIFSTDAQQTPLSFYQVSFVKAVTAGDVEQIRLILSAVLQSVDYEHLLITQESLVTAFVGFFILSCSFRVQVNEHQLSGRPDLCADSDFLKTSLIFEFKCVNTTAQSELDKVLQQAVEQLQSRHYGQTINHYPKMLRIAMVYSTNSRIFERAAAAD